LSYIADPQADEVTATQLAIQAEIEKGELPGSLGELQTDADCPDLLEAQRWLLAYQPAFVPGRFCTANGFETSMM
jgi:hypothetical protein